MNHHNLERDAQPHLGLRTLLIGIIALVAAGTTSAGCADDATSPGGGSTGSDSSGGNSTSTATGDSGDDAADSTGSGSDGGGQTPPVPPTQPPCDDSQNWQPISGGPYTLFREEPFRGGPAPVPSYSYTLPTPSDSGICPDLETLEGENLDIIVYRPDADGEGAWPSEPLPLVIHHHGQDQSQGGYEYLGELLAERGYVFLDVTTGGAIETIDETIACTLAWLNASGPQGGAQLFTTGMGSGSRLRCGGVTIMGHSEGAGRAHTFVRNRDADNLSDAGFSARFPPYVFGFTIGAYVGMAPSSPTADLPPEVALPVLVFGAGADDDAGGAAKSAYDRSPREEVRGSLAPPRNFIWVPTSHDAFGGVVPYPEADSNPGSAAVSEYLPRFLQSHIEGDNIEENRRILQFETFPEPLNDPDLYVGATAEVKATGYGAHGHYLCRGVPEADCANVTGCFWNDSVATPLCASNICGVQSQGTCNGTTGCFWDGGSCVDFDCELHVSSNCEETAGCVDWNGGCVNRPPIYGAYTPDARPVAGESPNWAEAAVLFEDEDASCSGLDTSFPTSQVTCGFATDLATQVDLRSGHNTDAMLVEWGDGAATEDGTVSVVGINSASPVGATHISFRVASLQVPTSGPPPIGQACTDEGEVHPLTLGVLLRSEGQELSVDPANYVQTPLIPAQQAGHYSCPQATMTTVRIPMSEFCNGDGLETDKITAIDFSFDDPDNFSLQRRAFLDSIEFTYTDGDEALACSGFSGMYACPATATFDAELTTCGGEPVSGVCQVGDIMTGTVDPPEVFDGTSNIDGWLIHVGTGIIDDPMSPTSSELAYIQDRCLQACEDEWQDDPDIRPNCSDTGALGTAYLVSSPSLGSRQAIPTAERDGSGIFTGESLSCSLHGDCCFEFDEDLCTAAPDRVTPQMQPLGTNEEFRVLVNPSQSQVESTSGMTTDTATLDGEIGYSFCRDGNASTACPFYVGSVHPEANSSLDVDVECPDGSLETITIDNLEVDLAQPAMGIDETGTNSKGFPTRSLVLDATFEVATQPYTIRGLNEVPVIVSAGVGEFDALDIPFRGEAPCTSGGTGTTRGEFDISLRFSAQATLGEPPTVAITMPSSTTCGHRETFSASVRPGERC